MEPREIYQSESGDKVRVFRVHENTVEYERLDGKLYSHVVVSHETFQINFPIKVQGDK